MSYVFSRTRLKMSFYFISKIVRALSFYHHFHFVALLDKDEIIFYSSTSIMRFSYNSYLKKILYSCIIKCNGFIIQKRRQFKRNGIIILFKFFAWFYSRKCFIMSVFRNLKLEIPTIYLILNRNMKLFWHVIYDNYSVW